MKEASCKETENPINQYAQERAERIARNKAVMAQLALKYLADEFVASIQPKKALMKRKPSSSRRKTTNAAPLQGSEPARRSVRQRGMPPASSSPAQSAPQVPQSLTVQEDELVSCEEYFKTQANQGISVAGSFHGWVNPELCEKYGISDLEEAVSGAPTAAQSQVSSGLGGRVSGWSQAQLRASKQLCTNPNAYFYRHVAPHEQQAQGNWTPEEHKLFLETAETHGVGDKWGLFASYIPQRVGYQCSAYYRDVVISQGLIYDPKFKMSKTGKPVYIG